MVTPEDDNVALTGTPLVPLLLGAADNDRVGMEDGVDEVTDDDG